MAKIDASSSLRTMEMWLLPFAAMFTQPSWLNAVALATGALLCLNRRTVCAALRAVDGSSDKGFSRFHRFLSRAEWSGLQGARILLGQLQKAFVPEGEPLVIADPNHFTYPLWPPAAMVDLVHWWGRTFDPALMAREACVRHHESCRCKRMPPT